MPLNPQTYNQLFTDASQLKAMAVVQENVDDKLITPIILDVQTIYMQPLMGTQLYSDIQDKIAVTNGATGITNSPPPLNNDELTLLNIYITPVMKYLVIRELTTTMAYQATNKGFLQAFADQARQPSSADINFLRVDAENKLQFYSERFVEYMAQFYYLFPRYLAVIQFSDIAPIGNGVKIPFAMGGTEGYGMGINSENATDFYRWFYLLHR